MNDMKRALVEIVWRRCREPEPLGKIDAAELVDRLLARIAEADDAVIEVAAKAHYEADGCQWDGGSYVDKESWRIDMRAALAAAMRAIGTQP